MPRFMKSLTAVFRSAAIESSDNESGGGSIPFEGPTNGAGNDEDPGDNNGEEESEGSEEEEDIYVVEKILGHEWSRNKLLLQVKWKGYEKEEDQTLEPEENLVEGAEDIVNEYYEKIGGKPEKPTKKRKSGAGADRAPTKKARKSQEPTGKTTSDEEELEPTDWHPKAQNWDPEVSHIDTITRDEEGLRVLVTWKNELKSRIPLKTTYKRLPQNMLLFYERHLTFKDI